MVSYTPKFRATLCVVISLLFLVVIPGTFAQTAPLPPPPTMNVYWYPTGHEATPYDTVNIQANVTDSSGIKSVTIYYRIGPWYNFRLNSISDYNRTTMQGPPAGSTHGIWFYDFEPQKNGTAIYFVVSAFDNSGLQTIYPGNQPFSNPQSILIEFPSQPYLSYVSVYFNTLSVGDTATQANISVSMAAYLPSPHEWPVYGVWVSPLDSPYSFGRLNLFESSNTRFFYQGVASSIIYLNPSNQIPYDTYTLRLNITLPYQFQNLTYATKYYSIQGEAATDVWNSFSLNTAYVPIFTQNNSTVQLIFITLSRRVPTLYPPLVLMLVALSVLGLVPLVSIYDPTKRFDVVLNVIILGSSAELSQAIYPAAGFQGNNIFLESFALILGATVLMTAISSLPKKFRVKKYQGLELEWYSTLGIIGTISVFICGFTNFPQTSKALTPFLGLLGLILVLVYRGSSKVLLERKRK